MKVGDKVKIVDLGKIYSDYRPWIRAHVPENLTEDVCVNMPYTISRNWKTSEYRVVAIGRHLVYDDNLVAIQGLGSMKGRVFVFNESGLEILPSEESIRAQKIQKIEELIEVLRKELLTLKGHW